MKAWKQANALSNTVQRAVALLSHLTDADAWPLYEAGAEGVEAAAWRNNICNLGLRPKRF